MENLSNISDLLRYRYCPSLTSEDDPCGIEFERIVNKYRPNKEILKSASVKEIYPNPPIAASFADKEKKFPIHNKLAAWLSAARVVEYGIQNPDLIKKIKNSLYYFDIDANQEFARLERIKEIQNNLEKRAQLEANKGKYYSFALGSRKDGTGRFSIATPEHVCKAAAFFHRNFEKFSFTDMLTFAKRCLHNAKYFFGKKASEWRSALTDPKNLDPQELEYLHYSNKSPQEIADRLEIINGQFVPDFSKFAESVLLKRHTAALYTNKLEELEHLQRALKILTEKESSNTPSFIVKAAHTVSRWDREVAKIKFDEDPYKSGVAILFSELEKVQGKLVKSAVSENWYNVEEAISKIPPQLWSAHFGWNPLLVTTEKVASFLADEKNAYRLEQFLSENGVFPLGSKNYFSKRLEKQLF